MDIFEIVGFTVMLLFLLAPLLRKLFGKKAKKKRLGEGISSEKRPMPTLTRRVSIAEEVQHYPLSEQVLQTLEPVQEEGPHRLSTVKGREFRTTFKGYEGMEATGEASFTPQIKPSEPIGKMGSRYEEDAAYRHSKEEASSIHALLKRPGIRREMVLLQEVISPPKSLQNYER